MKRKPAVAGQFYPGQPDILRKMVDGFLAAADTAPTPAIGLISPHAGYVYSGALAGRTFASVIVPDRVVILGPNHHGLGHPGAVYGGGSWLTPLGEMKVDSDLVGRLLTACPGLAADAVAHAHEHSLEVQVPFIQARAPGASIVPICLGNAPLEDLLRMGEAIGNILAALAEPVLMVASSDMTHYEPGSVAREKDFSALDYILKLDARGLFNIVLQQRISMCGVIPAVVMLAAARCLGAVTAEVAGYCNSGDVTGDQGQVVGYAGVVVR
jgi:MEMO1 family protein